MGHRSFPLASGLPLLALAACSTPAHESGPPATTSLEVQRFGTLREVLRDGRTQVRVALASLDLSELAIGLGALEGLAGEIAFARGELWVSREREGVLITERQAGELGATFLVRAEVDEWHHSRVQREESLADLETSLAALAPGRGAPPTWPFLVEARLAHLSGHVLRGACPFAAEPPAPGTEPLSVEREGEDALLVGVFSTEPPGTVAHHGTRLHVHAVLGGGAGPVVHVDDARFAAGAVLRTPWPDPTEEPR